MTKPHVSQRPSALELQCKDINWPVVPLEAGYLGNGCWSHAQFGQCGPEEIVAAGLTAEGALCSWCEGASLILLMKAAALDVLVIRNVFQDRTDAIRRFFEAQLTILTDRREEILSCIKTVQPSRLQENIAEICRDPFIQSVYPRAKDSFINSVAQVFKPGFVADIAEIFMSRPYEYRAGWPDLTIVKDGRVSFVEVKTKDKLHTSQIRFAREVAEPLNLPCSVVRLIPILE